MSKVRMKKHLIRVESHVTIGFLFLSFEEIKNIEP